MGPWLCVPMSPCAPAVLLWSLCASVVSVCPISMCLFLYMPLSLGTSSLYVSPLYAPGFSCLFVDPYIPLFLCAPMSMYIHLYISLAFINMCRNMHEPLSLCTLSFVPCLFLPRLHFACLYVPLSIYASSSNFPCLYVSLNLCTPDSMHPCLCLPYVSMCPCL